MSDQAEEQVQTNQEAPGQNEMPEAGVNSQTLQQELATAREAAAESENKYLRARADMDNFRKRIERTYAENLKSSKKELLNRLLAVKDNLERALRYGEAGQTNGEGLMEGIRLTSHQLDQLLSNEGVKPIVATGEPFNPHLEEAIQSVNDPNVPDHTVVQEVRKGYTYADEVLRPAQVIVSVHGE